MARGGTRLLAASLLCALGAIACGDAASQPEDAGGSATVPTIPTAPVSGGTSTAVTPPKSAEAPALAFDMNLSFRRAAFAPDGKRLATADDAAVVWDLATGLPGPLLPGGANGSESLMWSPDGSRLAFAGHNELRIFDPTKSEPLVKLAMSSGEVVVGMAWSRDGNGLDVASSDGTIQRVSTADAHVEKTTRPRGDRLSAAAWTPDGSKIAVVFHADSRTVLLDGATGKELFALDAPAEVSLAIEFDATGTRLLGVYNGESSVHVWDIASKRPGVVHEIKGTSRIEHASWSPDSKRIAVAGFDGVARVIDAKSGKELASLGAASREVDFVAWSPDGESLAVEAIYSYLWNVAKRTITQRIIGTPSGTERLTCSRDGSSVFTWDSDFGLTRWDLPAIQPTLLAGGRELRKLRDNGEARLHDRVVAMRPNENKDGALLVWMSGRLEEIGEGSLPPARKLEDMRVAEHWALSPDGTRIAASAQSTLSIWSVETGRLDVRRDVKLPILSAPVWSPDGTQLLLLGKDEARFVDSVKGEPRGSFTPAAPAVGPFGASAYAAVFSPKGDALAIDNGEHVDLFDLATKSVTKTFPITTVPVAWTASGRYLIGAKAHLIEVESGKIVSLPEPGWPLAGVCAAPDASWIALPASLGLRVRRTDGKTLLVRRVPVGDGWATAATSSDGLFDGDPAAIARLRARRGDKMVPLAEALTNRPGLVSKFLR